MYIIEIKSNCQNMTGYVSNGFVAIVWSKMKNDLPSPNIKSNV